MAGSPSRSALSLRDFAGRWRNDAPNPLPVAAYGRGSPAAPCLHTVRSSMPTPRRAPLSARHRWAVALVAAALPAGLVLAATPAAADDDTICAALTAPVYQRVDPDTQASTLS